MKTNKLFKGGGSKLSVSKCKLIPEQIEMCHRVACEQEKCYFEEEEVLNCLMMGPPPSLSYAASPFLLMLLSGNKLTLTRSYKYGCGWTHSWMNVVCPVAHIYPMQCMRLHCKITFLLTGSTSSADNISITLYGNFICISRL